MEQPVQLKFINKQNPKSTFDIIRLEFIMGRSFEDHSPFQLHTVEFYLILVIESGKGIHTIDFTDYKLEAGTLLTIRKDQIHKFHKNNTIRGTLLLFKDDFLISYLEKLEAQKSLQLFNEILGVPKIQLTTIELNEISNLNARIKAEYFELNDPYSLGIIRSELHILIAKLYRIKSQNNLIIENRKYLSQFINFQNLVEQHANQNTRVKFYAQEIGVSTKTLNTITRSIVHKTAKEFIDEISTNQIKRMLINTELTVKEIAYASGFEETTNFFKYFKRQTQQTPEQFRAKTR